MLSLKEHIGKTVGPYHEWVTAEQIQAFCKAIGVVPQDQEPPTFMTRFRKGEFDLFKILGFELSQILHAEQEYEIQNPIRAGTQVEYNTSVENILEKPSMQFIVFRSTVKEKNRILGQSKTTIVIRYTS